jgi:hypothetical protein
LAQQNKETKPSALEQQKACCYIKKLFVTAAVEWLMQSCNELGLRLLSKLQLQAHSAKQTKTKLSLTQAFCC